MPGMVHKRHLPHGKNLDMPGTPLYFSGEAMEAYVFYIKGGKDE